MLEEKYTLIDSEEILQFLQQKEYLVPVLIEAEKQIRKFFAQKKLGLKFICDPEIAGWRKLVITIHTNLNADRAFDQLKRLDHNWWLDASHSVANDLDIHVSFD